MTPYTGYQLHQAVRTRSVEEVREADLRIGELAAGLHRLGMAAIRPARALRSLRTRAPRRAHRALTARPRATGHSG